MISWQRHYSALIEYGKEHGTCNIRKRHSYECDLSADSDIEGGSYHYRGNLGEWLHSQRTAKIKKSGNKLPADHEEQLQKLVDEDG